MSPGTTLRAVAAAVALCACGGGRVASPPPAHPIAAEPDPPARSVADVCGELLADLARYEACADDDHRPLVHAWHERAKIDFAAAGYAGVAEADRADTARACGKADAAVKAAVAACPAPR